MKKYTTLYFDIDNTLLDFYASEDYAIRQVFKEFGLPCSDCTVKLYSEINKKYWQKFERNEMTKEQILVARFAETIEKLGFEKNPEEINARYFNMLGNCSFVIDGAKEILSCLKEKGYIICATTNGVAQTQFNRIEKSGLKEFFSGGIFVSEKTGHQKPEKEYYDYVLNNTEEKDKSKILVIGDSMTSDIKGGINFGVDTCWYNAYGEEKLYEPTYKIKKLCELNKIL